MRLWRHGARDTDFMEFHYNPSEISTSKSIQYEDDGVPGLKTTRPQFKQGNARTFSFTLFLNEFGESASRGEPKLKGITIKGRKVYDQNLTLRRRPVEEAIEWLEEHAIPSRQSSIDAFDDNEPPALMFQCWEVVIVVITSINVTRTLFHPTDFQAVRATVDLSLKEYLEHPGSGGAQTPAQPAPAS
jgi:hypothetical protein